MKYITNLRASPSSHFLFFHDQLSMIQIFFLIEMNESQNMLSMFHTTLQII